ncbi:MAG: MopE-related protein [bacterium]
MGQCTAGEQFCTVDLMWSRCSGDGPGVETCDGRDEDCDGAVDEGLATEGLCVVGTGACQAQGERACVGGVVRCTASPGQPGVEVCEGAVDEDCDGSVDEGLRNACGQCGALVETCDGQDEDCDGQVDEGSCHVYVLSEAGTWTTPPGASGGPLAGGPVDAAAAMFLDGPQVWAFQGDLIWIYHPDQDRWDDPVPLRVLQGQNGPVDTADAIPVWWARRFDPGATAATLTLTRQWAYEIMEVRWDPPRGTVIQAGQLAAAWQDDPRAPPSWPTVSSTDLRNGAGRWPGSPADQCGAAAQQLGPLQANLVGERLYVFDAGYCQAFLPSFRAAAWPGFRLPGAPDPARITAWAHVEPEAGGGYDVLFVR